MNEAIYRKIGNKYVRVSDDGDLWMYLRDGFYLIHAYEGGRSMKRVEPDRIGFKAAMKLASDAMVKAMLSAATPKPYENPGKPLGRKEKRAYAAYEKVMGKNAPAAWISESISGVIEAGLKAVE